MSMETIKQRQMEGFNLFVERERLKQRLIDVEQRIAQIVHEIEAAEAAQKGK